MNRFMRWRLLVAVLVIVGIYFISSRYYDQPMEGIRQIRSALNETPLYTLTVNVKDLEIVSRVQVYGKPYKHSSTSHLTAQKK